MKYYLPSLAYYVTDFVLKEIGADILVTGCSHWVAILSGVRTDKRESLPGVINIMDLPASAMGLSNPAATESTFSLEKL